MIFSKLYESTGANEMYADDYFEMADVNAVYEEYAFINQGLNMCMEALMISDITIDEQMLDIMSEAILFEGADPEDAQSDAEAAAGEESEKVSCSFKQKVLGLLGKAKNSFTNFASKVKAGLQSLFKNDAMEKYGEALANYVPGEMEIKVKQTLPNLKAGDAAVKKGVRVCLNMIKNPFRHYGPDSYPDVKAVKAIYSGRESNESVVSKKLVQQCMTIIKNKSAMYNEVEKDINLADQAHDAARSAIGKTTKETSSACKIINKAHSVLCELLTAKQNAYKEAAKISNTILNKIGSGKAEKNQMKANAKADKKAAKYAAKHTNDEAEPAEESYNDLFTRFLNGEI